MRPGPLQVSITFADITTVQSEARKNLIRRKYPRKAVGFQVGILMKGHYFVAQAQEIGEGGVSFSTDWILNEGQELLFNFFLTPKHFFSQRAVIRNIRAAENQAETQIIGCEFVESPFELRRFVRLFVNDSLEETVTPLGTQSPSRS